MKKTSARRITGRMLLALGCVAVMTLSATAAGAAERLPRTATDAHPDTHTHTDSGTHTGTRTDSGRGGRCVVVYFDLGETLVHTAEDKSISYMPGAAAHLRALRARNIPVGLITNVPSSWGATDAERAAELKRVIDKDWKGSRPFDWADFGDRIFTPRTEEERKPAPALWQRARDAAGGCRMVYQAETDDEIQASRDLGYVPYLVGRRNWPAYMPARLITALAHLPQLPSLPSLPRLPKGNAAAVQAG
ncbi:hypothetical protein ABT112_07800 [Streptomyces sp. NPDC002055]|uniref:hypothetical protein n=1 Tax=Streptomyces sp. NPDC002055 TaxID=3154534 RepID=UPI00332F696A